MDLEAYSKNLLLHEQYTNGAYVRQPVHCLINRFINNVRQKTCTFQPCAFRCRGVGQAAVAGTPMSTFAIATSTQPGIKTDSMLYNRLHVLSQRI